jgi:hypothetical protein
VTASIGTTVTAPTDRAAPLRSPSHLRLATRTVHRQIRSQAEPDNTGMGREHARPIGRHRLVPSPGKGFSA